MSKKKKLAFTLAEVLVTMTIISIVAVMTIPTLHYKRVKKEYTVRLKNFYSKVDNAILDLENDYGSFRDLKRPVVPDGGNINQTGYAWYMKYLDPYIGHKYVKNNTTIYFGDGSSLFFHIGSCLDFNYDVNGDKSPNMYGYDKFVFLMCFDDGEREGFFGSRDIFWGTYGANINAEGTTRAAMIAKCNSEKAYCTRLLQNDQWEFKDDYPLKF